MQRKGRDGGEERSVLEEMVEFFQRRNRNRFVALSRARHATFFELDAADELASFRRRPPGRGGAFLLLVLAAESLAMAEPLGGTTGL
jgi:hypothetical protein